MNKIITSIKTTACTALIFAASAHATININAAAYIGATVAASANVTPQAERQRICIATLTEKLPEACSYAKKDGVKLTDCLENGRSYVRDFCLKATTNQPQKEGDKQSGSSNTAPTPPTTNLRFCDFNPPNAHAKCERRCSEKGYSTNPAIIALCKSTGCAACLLF